MEAFPDQIVEIGTFRLEGRLVLAGPQTDEQQLRVTVAQPAGRLDQHSLALVAVHQGADMPDDNTIPCGRIAEMLA